MKTITAAAEINPEILLAIQSGVEAALKDVEKSGGDIKERTDPNQSIKGLHLNLVLELDEVNIGADTDKAPTSSIPLLAAMALLVKRMGCTRDAALQTLKEVMKQAITLDEKATKTLLEEQGVAEAAAQIKEEVIATLPRTKVKKGVRVKGANLYMTGMSQK